MNNKVNAREIAFIGLLGALSTVLMLFRFPLPFMPPFMDFDLASIPEVIGGFMLGPVPAVFIILVKILLKLATQGTGSAFTGEIQNFLLSCSYAVPAALIYRINKSKKSAVTGMAVGTALVTIMAVVTNIYMIIPFYLKAFGMSWEGIIGMCAAVNPLMKDAVSVALFGIAPFNIIKFGVSSVLTFIIYKKVSRPVKHIIWREG